MVNDAVACWASDCVRELHWSCRGPSSICGARFLIPDILRPHLCNPFGQRRCFRCGWHATGACCPGQHLCVSATAHVLSDICHPGLWAEDKAACAVTSSLRRRSKIIGVNRTLILRGDCKIFPVIWEYFPTFVACWCAKVSHEIVHRNALELSRTPLAGKHRTLQGIRRWGCG